MNHTPGPWAIKGNKIYGGLQTKGQPEGIHNVGHVNMGGLGSPGGDPIANAKLIAAAPELLEALKEMVDMYEKVQPVGGYQWYYDQAKSAIEKAIKG